MTKANIQTAAPLSLFRHVFGFQPGQTLSEFAKECSSLRDDEKFVAEVREYALANATE
jgi:hypothetical protein